MTGAAAESRPGKITGAQAGPSTARKPGTVTAGLNGIYLRPATLVIVANVNQFPF